MFTYFHKLMSSKHAKGSFSRFSKIKMFLTHTNLYYTRACKFQQQFSTIRAVLTV